MKQYFKINMILIVLILIIGCHKKPLVEVIKSFPLNDIKEIITQTDAVIDTSCSIDGKASIKIAAKRNTNYKVI